jgi:hypothetical protein
MGNFFKRIGDFVSNLFSTTVKDVEIYAVQANNLLNGIKAAVDSPTGQTIEGIIDTIIPGAATVFKTWLPDLFIAAGWVQAEFSKSQSQIVADGFNYLSNVAHPGIKAGNYNTVVANMTSKLAEIDGVSLPVQHALIIPQPIYLGLPLNNISAIVTPVPQVAVMPDPAAISTETPG